MADDNADEVLHKVGERRLANYLLLEHRISELEKTAIRLEGRLDVSFDRVDRRFEITDKAIEEGLTSLRNHMDEKFEKSGDMQAQRNQVQLTSMYSALVAASIAIVTLIVELTKASH